MKEIVAAEVAKRVKDGEVLGLGSGTTTELAIKAIGERIAKEGIYVRGVPTSLKSATVAAECGITVCDIRTVTSVDWAFDGADEVDPQLNLLKGRGAAMLAEKIVASLSPHLVILVTEDKLVKALGEKFAVPIEVLPSAAGLAKKRLLEIGAQSVTLREASAKYGEVTTEHGNVVLDTSFPTLDEAVESKILRIPGVVETGLFFGFNPEVMVASSTELYSLRFENGSLEKNSIG